MDFEEAAAFASTAKAPSQTDQLRLYGLYKQATVGECTQSKPGLLEFRNRAKWDAWMELKSLSSDTARDAYVALVTSLYPKWREIVENGGGGGGGGGEKKQKRREEGDEEDEEEEGGGGDDPEGRGFGGPVFSQLAELGGKEGGESETKDLFFFASEGDISSIKSLLSASSSNGFRVNDVDDMGQTMLHFACDRGHDELVRYLVQNGANVNAQTEDGSTPLHYAALNDQAKIVDFLTLGGGGADFSVVDQEGMTAFDVAGNEETKEILKRAAAAGGK